MTGKELLYIEDALGHEQYFQTQCKNTAAQLQDEELRQLVNELADTHKKLFDSFYELL